ncbi:MAG: DNA polymerase III subunit beta, partial [Chitinispirillaceae bacterium]|nr:DNA polymerase III subunit beta [Chitinispirillaceae bacterium]
MSILITKKNLFELLQKTILYTSTKSSMQVTSNFKLSFTNNIFEICATDFDHYISSSIFVEGSGDFKIIINAKKIFEIVKELPDAMVNIDASDNVLMISSEKGFSCKIAGVVSEEFPSIPEMKSNLPVITMPFKSYSELITKSGFAIAKEETKTVLRGVFFEVMEDKLGMVSTDGHRLGCSYIKNPDKSISKISCIISQKTLSNLQRTFEIEDLINISFDENYISFSTVGKENASSSFNIKVYSKLIEGTYPEYRKVIPTVNTKKAIINKNLLYSALRRVSVLANQNTHLIKCMFSSNKVSIVVFNRDIGGEATEEIPITYEGDDHLIGFNSVYLMEILDIIKTENIRMEMNTQISATLIFPFPKENEKLESEDIFLVMPLRIL